MSASITQRVCRWCSAPLVKSNRAWTDNEGAILCRNQNFPFHEPVAEPASTGEPQLAVPGSVPPLCNDPDCGDCYDKREALEHAQKGVPQAEPPKEEKP